MIGFLCPYSCTQSPEDKHSDKSMHIKNSSGIKKYTLSDLQIQSQSGWVTWRNLTTGKNSFTPQSSDRKILTLEPEPTGRQLPIRDRLLGNVPHLKPGRSVYRYTRYAYCQGFLPFLFLPSQSIHLHFFKNLFWFFPVLAVAKAGSCVGAQNKIGHPAGCRFPCWVPMECK